ncbi:MAG: endonuclease domain-containing protein [Solirubrobacteraceae bacterium]
MADRRALERGVERAESMRLFDLTALNAVLARANGRRGAPALRDVLARYDAGSELTRSELERRFLDLCRAAIVPPPRVNAPVELAGCQPEADFAWPEHRLIVETDGHETHGTREAFERDRRRDQRLIRAGWRVVRFTWRQVVHEPREVTATLQALLPSSPASQNV